MSKRTYPGGDTGGANRCPYCSFSPESDSDYCAKHHAEIYGSRHPMSAPVLGPSERAAWEALREAAKWMRHGAEKAVEGMETPIVKQHAAWCNACTAIDALLAAEPETVLFDAAGRAPAGRCQKCGEPLPCQVCTRPAAPALEPRYACMACDFTENSAHGANRHHDATGHNMRWTGRRATDEELADDCAPAPDAAAAALLAAPEPEGARGVPRQVTGDWMGTWRNWIAPFHFCPRCGESLNWRQCLDALDSPMITTECCGIHHSADGMIAKLAEKCSPAPAVRDAAPEGEGARCADCGLPYGGPAEVSP